MADSNRRPLACQARAGGLFRVGRLGSEIESRPQRVFCVRRVSGPQEAHASPCRPLAQERGRGQCRTTDVRGASSPHWRISRCAHSLRSVPPSPERSCSPPPNAQLERFMPPGAVLPRAAALVTQGGLGTATKALIHGVRRRLLRGSKAWRVGPMPRAHPQLHQCAPQRQSWLE